MKMMLFSLRAILFCFIATNLVHASEQSLEYKDWSVSSQNGTVRYIANGFTVHGHQFGFIKMAKNCNQDLLWISWSTYEKGVESFKGSDATIQLRVGETKFQIEITLVFVYEFTPTLRVVAFTNFVAGEKFISLLQKGNNIQVTIISPNELVRKFDIPTDTFSLNGFSAARSKAKEFCEGLE